MGSCQVCRKVSKLSCVCGKASYCGVECQKKDWKDHKPSCPPFVIRESPGKGRGLFATRKIKQGQLILEEYPFLITQTKSACLYYFMINVYPNIDEDTKTKILELHDPADNLKTLDAQTAEKLVRTSKDPMMKFYVNAETDEMSRIFRIFYGHSIKICIEKDLYRDNTEGGLYTNISLMNHSCLPNTSCSWVMGDFRRKQVRAIKIIEKDEEILINYHSGPEISYGSREFRRQLILEYRGFLCGCSECSLEGEEREENDRMRAEIRQKDEELNQLNQLEDPFSRKPLKKAMKLFQQRLKLIQKLNIWAGVVAAMIEFYHLAVTAREMGISCENDPQVFKQEAWKYAQMFGDNHIHLFNKRM